MENTLNPGIINPVTGAIDTEPYYAGALLADWSFRVLAIHVREQRIPGDYSVQNNHWANSHFRWHGCPWGCAEVFAEEGAP